LFKPDRKLADALPSGIKDRVADCGMDRSLSGRQAPADQGLKRSLCTYQFPCRQEPLRAAFGLALSSD